ncbi:hypothetical protein JW933_05010, partial [candidate division FCPU426 bacterium]|nr:hypothetical protein [candidate division FCPU426 bacterium]
MKATALALCCAAVLMPSLASAAVTAWEDEFDRNENPVTGWSLYQVNMVAMDTGSGYGYITLTTSNWGNVDSDDITLDTDSYQDLAINVTGLSTGLGFRVAILHGGSTTTFLNTFQYTPGVYNFNYVSTVRGVNPAWTGTQTFRVRIFVEGPFTRSDTATVDYIRITGPGVGGSPTFTPTPTPTATEGPPSAVGWEDEFDRNETPPTGWSLNQVSMVAMDTGPGYGYITLTGSNWGNADSDDIILDTDVYQDLAINVTGLSTGLGFRVAILHGGSTTTFLHAFQYSPGVYNFNYVSTVRGVNPAWTGTQTFKVRIFVEGPVVRTDTATVDYVRITGAGVGGSPTSTSTPTPTPTEGPPASPTFTPTATPTSTEGPALSPTFTPTASPTSTATPTSTNTPAQSIGWEDEFDRNETPPTGWNLSQVNMVA